MFNPVDETEEEPREKISLYGRNGKGDSLNHYSIENNIENPEDYAVQEYERDADRKNMERKREEFEYRLYDGIEDAHDDAANGEESNAARVGDIG